MPDFSWMSRPLGAGGFQLRFQPIEVDAAFPDSPLPAYARVFIDALKGRHVLSVRDDEAEAAWRIVDPILEAWAAGASPLRGYAAGSHGPSHDRLPGG